MQKPTIHAEFETDAKGRLVAPKQSGGRKHYGIRFSVDGAPEDAFAVIYLLHETYYDPVREVRTAPEFAEGTTSYGDYIVRADINRSNGSTEVASAWLSDALKERYRDTSDPRIKQAIADIENN